MPIKIQSDLPVKEILEKENLFVMDENRAMHQDIRPIYILILNLMPLKEETELQLLRSLSNTPLQVDVSFMAVESHQAKNTSRSHLNKFYQTFSELKDKKFDGMIITGAPVEQMEFEEVDYWEEVTQIMDWSETHVTSTIFLCWAAQAALYHFYGLKKRKLDKKMFGLFWHKVMNRKIPLVRGFDDIFLAPHSRHTEVPIEAVHACKDLTVLAESDEVTSSLYRVDRSFTFAAKSISSNRPSFSTTIDSTFDPPGTYLGSIALTFPDMDECIFADTKPLVSAIF